MLPIRSEVLAAFGLASLLLVSPQTRAEPAQTLADGLGGPEFTPVGAERPGNAAGTIPAWVGGITKPPADFDPGRMHTDPFRDDVPLFSVDASNLEDHLAQVGEGHRALLRAHPETMRLDVYPTRRSASYPAWVYEGIAHNAVHARLSTVGKGWRLERDCELSLSDPEERCRGALEPLAPLSRATRRPHERLRPP